VVRLHEGTDHETTADQVLHIVPRARRSLKVARGIHEVRGIRQRSELVTAEVGVRACAWLHGLRRGACARQCRYQHSSEWKEKRFSRSHEDTARDDKSPETKKSPSSHPRLDPRDVPQGGASPFGAVFTWSETLM